MRDIEPRNVLLGDESVVRVHCVRGLFLELLGNVVQERTPFGSRSQSRNIVCVHRNGFVGHEKHARVRNVFNVVDVDAGLHAGKQVSVVSVPDLGDFSVRCHDFVAHTRVIVEPSYLVNWEPITLVLGHQRLRPTQIVQQRDAVRRAHGHVQPVVTELERRHLRAGAVCPVHDLHLHHPLPRSGVPELHRAVLQTSSNQSVNIVDVHDIHTGLTLHLKRLQKPALLQIQPVDLVPGSSHVKVAVHVVISLLGLQLYFFANLHVMDLSRLNNPIVQNSQSPEAQQYQSLLDKYAQVHAAAQRLSGKQAQINKLVRYLELRNNMLVQLLIQSEANRLSKTHTNLSPEEEHAAVQNIIDQKPFLEQYLSPLLQDTEALQTPELLEFLQVIENNPTSSVLGPEFDSILNLDASRKRKSDSVISP
ncbi:hypothetical protein OGAPHI_001036 [Ogataea philodendri]|uniref:Uncharacterized protein n=1 Tax=Ogataea philodendri TaxID=1378263 RepID=A0A9P8T9Y0_9ASCO|nr:uncharacterized protein OGAPHI_001036 [Ogataea philodendri]KAH3670521.1 hypothetical protein OGAPHI_001036 [Ogataea philodendri]